MCIVMSQLVLAQTCGDFEKLQAPANTAVFLWILFISAITKILEGLFLVQFFVYPLKQDTHYTRFQMLYKHYTLKMPVVHIICSHCLIYTQWHAWSPCSCSWVKRVKKSFFPLRFVDKIALLKLGLGCKNTLRPTFSSHHIRMMKYVKQTHTVLCKDALKSSEMKSFYLYKMILQSRKQQQTWSNRYLAQFF